MRKKLFKESVKYFLTEVSHIKSIRRTKQGGYTDGRWLVAPGICFYPSDFSIDERIKLDASTPDETGIEKPNKTYPAVKVGTDMGGRDIFLARSGHGSTIAFAAFNSEYIQFFSANIRNFRLELQKGINLAALMYAGDMHVGYIMPLRLCREDIKKILLCLR